MNGYIINFLVYTMAMIGIMLLSVIIYKKTALCKNFGGKKSAMKIEETLSLSPKKTLYVVNVQNERFLIASDLERTSFLAKLGEKDFSTQTNIETFSSEQIREKTPKIIPGVDIEEIRRANAMKKKMAKRNSKTFNQVLEQQAQIPEPVMKSLATKIRLKRG